MYNTNAQSLAAAFPGVEGGLDAAVDVPSASVDMPSGSVDVPSVDLSGKAPDMPSVGGEISGDLPSVDAKLTGPCLLYTSPSPRDLSTSRMPSSA